MEPVHVIGGGLAGSEAAWQIVRAGVPVVLHEMRPVRATDAHRTDRLAELVCSNSFRSDDAATNAVGMLHREMRALGSLIMACGGCPPGAGGRRAGGRSRWLCQRRHGGHRRRATDRYPPRRDRRPAARRLGQRHHRHRPADLAGTGAADPGAHRRGRTRLLRRDRADRPSRLDRHGQSLVPVALRQGRSGRHRRRLHQLPADRATSTKASSTRCSPRRRPSFANSKARPTSTAACRSRSWRRAVARRYATAR